MFISFGQMSFPKNTKKMESNKTILILFGPFEWLGSHGPMLAFFCIFVTTIKLSAL